MLLAENLSCVGAGGPPALHKSSLADGPLALHKSSLASGPRVRHSDKPCASRRRGTNKRPGNHPGRLFSIGY